MRVVVVGTGPAGVTAAETARHLDPSASVTVLSSEPFAPYSPPAMADHFLTGRRETLFWKGDGLEPLGIDERRESVVEGVDTDHHEVVLAGGERIAYDSLVVASGSRLYAPLEGAELPGVHDFKSLRTATRLVEQVRRGEATRALVVGAGLIGIELALLLAELGVQVTVLERESRAMPRILDDDTAGVVAEAVRQRGVTLRLGVTAEAFSGTDGGPVSGVRLGSGEVLRADVCVAATGVKPHTELLEGSGIDHRWGVTVDERLATTARDVFAAGDVAEAADWFSGERYVHAIFPNAVAQGRVAGTNAVGGHATYDGAEAMNSLKHLDVPVIAMGTLEDPDEIVRHRDGTGLRSLYLRDGRIVGAQVAGDTRAAGIYHSLMRRRADVRRFGDRLVDPAFSMADVVWGAVRSVA